MIDSIITNNNRQIQLGTLTGDQQAFQNKIEDLKQVIVSIRLTKTSENLINISLWDADGEENDEETIKGCSFSDNLQTKIDKLDEFGNYLSETMDVEYRQSPNSASLKEGTFYQNLKKTIYVYWFNKSYGHLDQVRVDLEKSYKGQELQVQATDGSSLDTMWIQNQSNDNQAPTVMFCNPNGVYYETFAYDGQWLEFYLDRGFNVFLWNYRGYGRSKGPISPNKLFEDGDDLVNHLKNVRGVGKLLVHGLSLGGGVAGHLSNNPNVDVIFADRTFSSLDSVVRDDFGRTLRFIYNLATLFSWKMHGASKFLQSTKYKIISCDSRDDMIPELASLKNGVTRAVIKKDILMNKRSFRKSMPKKFYDIHPVLEKSQSETMFKILKEIFTLNLSKANELYAKAKSNVKNKKKDEDFEKNNSIELNFLEEQNPRLDNEEGFNVSGTNYSAHSETFLDKSTSVAKLESDK